MRCSECSKEVKPVVAFDIDGTLGDYHGHLVDFACGYLDKAGPVESNLYDGEGNFGTWFCEVFQVSRDKYRQIKLAYRQGGHKRTMPIYGNAVELVRQFQSNCEIWLTTTRPYNRLDSVDPDTREWLRRHHIPYDYLIYAHDKYEQLAKLVDEQRVISVVDDLPEMYDAAVRLFGVHVPILRQTDWNKSQHRLYTFNNLDDIRKIIIVKYQDWMEING